MRYTIVFTRSVGGFPELGEVPITASADDPSIAKSIYLNCDAQRQRSGGKIELYKHDRIISPEQLLADASALEN